jgi:hypothetical protein
LQAASYSAPAASDVTGLTFAMVECTGSDERRKGGGEWSGK